MTAHSRGRERMAGIGSVKGPPAGTCGNGARLTEIGYADRYGTAALAWGT